MHLERKILTFIYYTDRERKSNLITGYPLGSGQSKHWYNYIILTEPKGEMEIMGCPAKVQMIDRKPEGKE